MSEGLIPHEVVQLHLVGGASMVKAWRIYRQMSQAEVSEATGIAQGTYAAIENGEKPEREMLERLAQALNITVDQLGAVD